MVKVNTMTMRCWIIFLLLIIGTPSLDSQASEQNLQKLLEFIYIDATEGEAAAGHSAVKLGSTVFHYQFHSKNLLLLSKQDWEKFRYYYNDLSNRTITIKAVPLSDSSFQKIKHSFQDQYLRQEIDLARHASLIEKARIFRKFSYSQNYISLDGVGFFSPAHGAGIEIVRQLKNKLNSSFSDNFLKQLQNKTEEEISLVMKSMGQNFSEQTEISLIDASIIVKLKELLSLREVLNILTEERGLLATSIVRGGATRKELEMEQWKHLQQFQQRIGSSIIDLLRSTRADKGPVLLIQVARYLVIGLSLEQNELLTLTPFQNEAIIKSRSQEKDSQLFAYFHEEAHFFSNRLQKTFFSASPEEQSVAYSMLEKAQGCLQKYEQNANGEMPDWTQYKVCGIPCRSGKVSIDFFTHDILSDRTLEAQQKAVNDSMKYLMQKYGYSLSSRNCATELVRTINKSFAGKENVHKSLGSYLEPGEGVSFVPFGLDNAVSEKYQVMRRQDLPSYRLRNLGKMYQQEGLGAWVRESNTLTSTLYSPWKKDGYFLFFTDDTIVTRPVFGLINLGYSLLHTIGGVVTAPLDKGSRFMRGLNGVVFSFPELFFFNIRKGSYQIIDNNY